jgi:hypothetical protein
LDKIQQCIQKKVTSIVLILIFYVCFWIIIGIHHWWNTGT